ncbi:hypothetical protein DFH09DRAFT_1228922 [Mycena vulgaris]|nr:hypothetical protein DFH09DRAFT_1228922 [Mycena vulgaris]
MRCVCSRDPQSRFTCDICLFAVIRPPCSLLPTMASRVGRQAFSTTVRATRSARSSVHPPRRLMSADAAAHHEPFKPKSDMPWIIAAVAITAPSLAYLLKDTVEIKKRISAGHHGHDSHDSHAAHEDHAAPAVMKDSEGTEADVSASLNDAAAADAPQAAGATSDDSPADAAAEPPKDEHETEKEESK